MHSPRAAPIFAPLSVSRMLPEGIYRRAIYSSMTTSYDLICTTPTPILGLALDTSSALSLRVISF
jgi:hypothetical protein